MLHSFLSLNFLVRKTCLEHIWGFFLKNIFWGYFIWFFIKWLVEKVLFSYEFSKFSNVIPEKGHDNYEYKYVIIFIFLFQ
jgi:hypothetical protein